MSVLYPVFSFFVVSTVTRAKLHFYSVPFNSVYAALIHTKVLFKTVSIENNGFSAVQGQFRPPSPAKKPGERSPKSMLESSFSSVDTSIAAVLVLD